MLLGGKKNNCLSLVSHYTVDAKLMTSMSSDSIEDDFAGHAESTGNKTAFENPIGWGAALCICSGSHFETGKEFATYASDV